METAGVAFKQNLIDLLFDYELNDDTQEVQKSINKQGLY